jgi:hypothetical protein
MQKFNKELCLKSLIMQVSVHEPNLDYYKSAFPLVDRFGFHTSGVSEAGNVIVRCTPFDADRVELVIGQLVLVHCRDDTTGRFYPITLPAMSTLRLSDGRVCVYGEKTTSHVPNPRLFRIYDLDSMSFRGMGSCKQDGDRSNKATSLEDLVWPGHPFLTDLVDPLLHPGLIIGSIPADETGHCDRIVRLQTPILECEGPPFGRVGLSCLNQVVADGLLVHDGNCCSAIAPTCLKNGLQLQLLH